MHTGIILLLLLLWYYSPSGFVMFATNALTGADPATFVSSITIVPFIGMTYPAFTESQNKPQELRQLRRQIPKRILS